MKFIWQSWLGFLLIIFAFISHPLIFVEWPLTRDFPWVGILLIALGLFLVFVGVRKAFRPERGILSKVGASAAAVLSVLIVGLFIFTFFIFATWLPKSAEAPKIGSSAPEFQLADTNGQIVSLESLETQPIQVGDKTFPVKGTLLIFYRGYW